MTPYINPSIFYWLKVIISIHELSFAITVFDTIIFVVAFVICQVLSDDEYERQAKKVAKRIAKITSVILIISLLLTIFLPDKDTCITMLVVQQITPDNLEFFGETIEDAMDNVKEFIIEILNATKEETQ